MRTKSVNEINEYNDFSTSAHDDSIAVSNEQQPAAFNEIHSSDCRSVRCNL